MTTAVPTPATVIPPAFTVVTRSPSTTAPSRTVNTGVRTVSSDP